jgi:hypothetical protein
MVYYATIHYKNANWIKIQHDFIVLHTPKEYEWNAIVHDCGELSLYRDYGRIYTQDQGSHAKNLNYLANEIILRSKSNDDIIIFIDGDAFPIVDISKIVDKVCLEQRPAAVQRLENNGDCQPHPCFAIFTVGMWKKYSGDWSSGYQWQNPQGDLVTDVGGEMLKIFQKRKIDWIKLKRTNSYNLHHLLFGVYGDVVYHHGAAFRLNDGGRITRLEHNYKEKLQRIDARIIEKITPNKYRQRIRNSMIHPAGRLYHKLVKENSKLAELVYQQIKRDPDYVYTFIN